MGEYIPFESVDEFLDAYEDSTYINCGSVGNKLLSRGGIWLKCKFNNILIVQCIEISNKGIVIGTNNYTTFWKDLLDDYKFLDGTPCGKLKEA